MVVPVAASAFATDSVEGQRARPSGVMRFDLLKVVGSRPDFLARPGRREPGAGGEAVERRPDLGVGEHERVKTTELRTVRNYYPICRNYSLESVVQPTLETRSYVQSKAVVRVWRT